MGREALKVGRMVSTPQNSRLLLQRLHKHWHLIILILLGTMYVQRCSMLPSSSGNGEGMGEEGGKKDLLRLFWIFTVF